MTNQIKIKHFKYWLYELSERELCNGREKIMEFVESLEKSNQVKVYIFKKDCPNIGKEIGDYYNNEYGESVEALLANGVIEEDKLKAKGRDKAIFKNSLWSHFLAVICNITKGGDKREDSDFIHHPCYTCYMPYKNKKDLNKMYRRVEFRRRIKVLALLGSKCVTCGITEKEVLTIDHIIPFGNKFKGRLPYRRMLMSILRNDYDLSRLQLLCANCHMKKTQADKQLRHGSMEI